MTTWQEVAERAREVARDLSRKGRPTVRYENAYGVPVDCWQLDSMGCITHDIEYTGGTNYDETYDENYLLLGDDGVIYMFILLKLEKGRREPGGFRVTVDKTPMLYTLTSRMSHLKPYKRPRCSEVMRLLDRLAQKKNSDREPEAPDSKRTEVFSKDPDKPVTAVQPVEPSYPAPGHAAWPNEPEEKRSPWITVLLILGPFVFLGLLALVLLLFGAQPN